MCLSSPRHCSTTLRSSPAETNRLPSLYKVNFFIITILILSFRKLRITPFFRSYWHSNQQAERAGSQNGWDACATGIRWMGELQDQCLFLFYQLLNGHFNVPPEEIQFVPPACETKTSHNKMPQSLKKRTHTTCCGGRQYQEPFQIGIHWIPLQLRPIQSLPSNVSWLLNDSALYPPH